MDKVTCQTAGATHALVCCGEQHLFPSFDGEPVSLDVWHGLRCHCGAVKLEVHECDCGHRHLRRVAERAVPPTEGGASDG